MKRSKRLFIALFITGAFAVFNGSYLKISGNQNADIIVISGIVMEVLAVLGIIFANLKRKPYLK